MRPLEVATLGSIRPPTDAILAAAEGAEAEGFDAIWWSDHFLHWFPPGVWTPDLVPHAAVMRSPHAFLDPAPVIAAAASVRGRWAAIQIWGGSSPYGSTPRIAPRSDQKSPSKSTGSIVDQSSRMISGASSRREAVRS